MPIFRYLYLTTSPCRRYALAPLGHALGWAYRLVESLTHLDYLLFSKVDKSPITAIEVENTKYHAEGSSQAERDAMKNSILDKCDISILRIRTNERSEESNIITMLRKALQ